MASQVVAESCPTGASKRSVAEPGAAIATGVLLRFPEEPEQEIPAPGPSGLHSPLPKMKAVVLPCIHQARMCGSS